MEVPSCWLIVDSPVVGSPESPCLRAVFLNPNPEIENGRDGAFWGAHASGVWFSASRRKPRPANFFAPEIPEIVCVKSSGATPEPARGTRALPIPVSEFGLKGGSPALFTRFSYRQSNRINKQKAQPAQLLNKNCAVRHTKMPAAVSVKWYEAQPVSPTEISLVGFGVGSCGTAPVRADLVQINSRHAGKGCGQQS
jgi:hypothetical protein